MINLYIRLRLRRVILNKCLPFFRKFPHHFHRRVIYVNIYHGSVYSWKYIKSFIKENVVFRLVKMYIQVYDSLCISLWEGKLIYLIICHKKWKIFFKCFFFFISLCFCSFFICFCFRFCIFLGGGVCFLLSSVFCLF